jgi:branched-chain amino acid transport system ATP-binding protein
MSGLLCCVNVSKHFGQVKAADGVNLSVKEGSIHSIIGPNGAGKTTLFNCLSGEVRPTSGEIVFAGISIKGKQPFQLPALGLSRSFQKTSIFPSLTVAQNIWVSAHKKQAGGAGIWARADKRQDVHAVILDVLRRTGLERWADRPAAALDHGNRRLLDLAIALAPDPRLLLLDEPAAGLSPSETQRVAGLLESLRPRHTVLLVEHKMDVIMKLSDWITVMHLGKVLAEGPPEDIAKDVRVREAYLGRRK